MSIDETKLAAVLQEKFGLSQSHLELARAWQKERGGSLADILFEMRAVSESDLKKAHESLGHNEVAQKYDGRNRRRVVLAPAEVVALVFSRSSAAVESASLVAVLGLLDFQHSSRHAVDATPRRVYCI